MRMLNLLLVLFVVSAALVVGVVAWQGWTQVNMSQEAFALSQDVQKLKLEKELEEVRRAKQQDAIEYRLQAAKLNAKERLATSGLVAASRELGAATLYLWPVVVVVGAAMGGGLYAYSRRQATVQAIETARHTELIQQEQAILKTMERSMPALVRGMMAAIPRQAEPVPVVEAIETPEPTALRAFSGPVYFSQAKLDPDYDDRLIMWGRDVETGGIRQQALEDVESLVINGLQKQGKSTLLEAIAHNSLLRQYVYGESVRTVLVDLHAGAPRDSLSKQLDAYCPGVLGLFHKTFLGEHQIESDLTAYLDALFESFQPGKNPECDELVIIIDEYTETIANLETGKDIEARVKRLFNRRKYGVRLILAMFESSKSHASAKGLNVSKMAVSKALFRMDSAEGKRFLKDADGCQTLEKGEYLLMTPGEMEASRIQGPMFSAMDFQPFQNFTQDAPQLADGTVADSVTDDQGVSMEATEDELTPEKVKKLMTESLSKTAKASGVPKSTLSNFLNGKGQLSDVQADALRAYLMPEDTDVINFEQRRSALLKRANSALNAS